MDVGLGLKVGKVLPVVAIEHYPTTLPTIKQAENTPSTHAFRFLFGNAL